MEVQLLPEILKGAVGLEKRSPDFFLKFKDQKTRALNFLNEKGLPTKKDEDWIYTQIQKNMAFRVFEHKSDLVQTLPTTLKIDSQNMLVFVNGVLNHGLTKIQDALVVTENADVFSENYFDGLHALNDLLALRAYEITVPKKLKLTAPLYLVHLSDENALNRIVSPKLKLNLEAFSEGSIVEVFATANRDLFQYTTNALTEIHVAENANFEFIKTNIEAKKAVHIGLTKAVLKRDSTLNIFTSDFGNLTSRENLEVTLIGENARTNHFGFMLLKQEEHGDVFTKIKHDVPHCNSSQLVKTVIADTAHGAFTGNISIAKNAIGVESAQLNNNMLTSKKAHIDTRPQLVVSADDVKCAHGATIGQLSSEEAFYLESRGLSKQRSKMLLCHGFLYEVILKIENLEVQKFLGNFLESELSKIDFENVQ